MVHNGLNLMTFNVRSLIEVSRRIDLLYLLNSNYIDVAFIQETHLKEQHSISLEDYTFFKDSSSQGVGIVIKNNYKCSKIEILDLEFPNIFLDVEIIIDNVPKHFLFGSIYIPCNFNQLKIYNGLSVLARYFEKFDGIFIGGDFNAKNISWGDNINNSNGNIFFNWLQHYCTHFVRICNTFPSFPNGSSFLDHFLISSNLIDNVVPNYKVFSLSTFSDHFPLKLQFSLQDFDFILNPPSTFTSFKNTNWNKFRNNIIHQFIKR